MNGLKLSVCGCALIDHLYTSVDFSAPAVRRILSRKNGDGGLAIGKLVFTEDLEQFAGMSFDAIREQLTGGDAVGVENIGGPGIVGAINASQILWDKNVTVRFYGAMGDDESGDFFREIVSRTEVDLTHLLTIPGPSPCTFVFSDPRGNDGKGERTFANRLGAANEMAPAHLDSNFFQGDVLWFSATALVPQLHDHLGALLRKGRAAGKINVVSTVFDFRNEKKDPSAPWPLGDSDSWKDIDLLIVDCDEALRLSGCATLPEAMTFLCKSGVSAFFVTHGAKHFYAWSDGRLFLPSGRIYELPVSALADKDMMEHPERRGDTTGCGDNFAGGIVASLFLQMYEDKKPSEFSLLEAAAWGAASGGAACFQIGGTYMEKNRGEKFKILSRYADSYAKETSNFSL